MTRIAILLLAAAACRAQVAKDANAEYQTKEGRAQIAGWLDSSGRDAELRPAELVAALRIQPGETVVDLGTGAGHMLPYLSRAVGPGGKVIAEDIQADFLDRARAKAKENGVRNVEFVLGTEDNPKLPPGAADLILVLDTYHHFNYPEKMLAGIRSGLRRGGRLAIVEFYRRPGAMGGDPNRALQHVRADAPQVAKEVEATGFQLLWRKDHVPGKQYIAMFMAR